MRLRYVEMLYFAAVRIEMKSLGLKSLVAVMVVGLLVVVVVVGSAETNQWVRQVNGRLQ